MLRKVRVDFMRLIERVLKTAHNMGFLEIHLFVGYPRVVVLSEKL